MRKTLTALTITTVTLAGCATAPDKIDAAYVSPILYSEYTCEQLAQEAARVSERASQATGIQKKKAKADATAVGVGLILFWPALLFVKGDNANETELARLKGEMDTIEKVSIQKQCGFQFQGEQPQQQAMSAPTVVEAPLQ